MGVKVTFQCKLFFAHEAFIRFRASVYAHMEDQGFFFREASRTELAREHIFFRMDSHMIRKMIFLKKISAETFLFRRKLGQRNQLALVQEMLRTLGEGPFTESAYCVYHCRRVTR